MKIDIPLLALTSLLGANETFLLEDTKLYITDLATQIKEHGEMDALEEWLNLGEHLLDAYEFYTKLLSTEQREEAVLAIYDLNQHLRQELYESPQFVDAFLEGTTFSISDDYNDATAYLNIGKKQLHIQGWGI